MVDRMQRDGKNKQVTICPKLREVSIGRFETLNKINIAIDKLTSWKNQGCSIVQLKLPEDLAGYTINYSWRAIRSLQSRYQNLHLKTIMRWKVNLSWWNSAWCRTSRNGASPLWPNPRLLVTKGHIGRNRVNILFDNGCFCNIISLEFSKRVGIECRTEPEYMCQLWSFAHGKNLEKSLSLQPSVSSSKLSEWNW